MSSYQIYIVLISSPATKESDNKIQESVIAGSFKSLDKAQHLAQEIAQDLIKEHDNEGNFKMFGEDTIHVYTYDKSTESYIITVEPSNLED